MLNKKSGLLGLSGVSSDMREILQGGRSGQPSRVARAQGLLLSRAEIHRRLCRIDGRAGCGDFHRRHRPGQRSGARAGVAGLGVHGHHARRQAQPAMRAGDEVCRISTDDSKVTVLVVPTDEERMMAREALRTLSRSYITRVLEAQKQQPFLVEVSAHHIHLTQEHVEALFGKGHQLTKHADLSQPGQYACKEQLTIVGPKGRIERVRILGPRANTRRSKSR